MKKLIAVTVDAVESYILINKKQGMKNALLMIYIKDRYNKYFTCLFCV